MPLSRFVARGAFLFAIINIALILACGLLLAHPAQADSWALLIGIDQYKDSNRITSLGGAAADARALAKTLHDVAGFADDHIQLLVSDSGDVRPTRGEILDALTRLAANAKPGDTVFVLYSGHGMEIDGMPYLLPYDTSALSDANIVDTALETEKFTKRLRQIKAKALVLVFDMCRSDPRKNTRAVGASETDNKLTKAQVRGLDLAGVASTGNTQSANGAGAPIAITFYSCSPDERSYEDRLQSRGYFSEYLEKGLRGAAADSGGTVRVASLAKYLEINVHTAVAVAENGASQTPYPEMNGPGVQDFALVNGSAPATPAVVVVSSVVTPLDTYAHLTVNVNAPNAIALTNATVLLDGKPITPGQEASLDLRLDKTKQVEVGIAADGYTAVRQNVLLTAGAHATLPVTLTALPPPRVERPTPPIAAPSGGDGTTAGAIKTNEKDGAEMVYVPAGPFLMGDSDVADNPRHRVTLSGYYIYKNLVTVAMYRKFCAMTRKMMPSPPPWGWKEDNPIVDVSWNDAMEYCDWAGVTLPTEAQWEKAARGEHGLKFPWGNEFDANLLWCSANALGDASGTRSVGSFPKGASPYGALDMAGNVLQWCADFYDADFCKNRGTTDAADPVNAIPSPKELRALRCGPWGRFGAGDFRTAVRYGNYTTSCGNDEGFRCVVPAK